MAWEGAIFFKIQAMSISHAIYYGRPE